jgi:hAT family C-terminal dimerisation region
MGEKIDLFNDTSLTACLLDPRTKNMMTAQLFGFTVAHLQRASLCLTKHLEDSFDRQDSLAADQAAIIPVPSAVELNQKPLGNSVDALDNMFNKELNARPYFGAPGQARDNLARAEKLVNDWVSSNPDPGRTLQFRCKPGNGDALLKWWQQHEGTWPEVADAARLYLAIPATSAPSERLFSTCRRVSSGDRANISSDRLEAVVRLHENQRKRARARTSFLPSAAEPVPASADIDFF